MLGNVLQVAVPLRGCGLGRVAGHRGRAWRDDDGRFRMATGEYRACPPRVVRGSAAQAATASSVNHTVKLPR